MDTEDFEEELKKVYVDASSGRRSQAGGDWCYVLAYLVEHQIPKQIKYDSSLNYLQRKIETDEAEYLAIIYALSSVDGNVMVFSDSKQIIRDLQKGRVTFKNRYYFQRISELSRGRVVKFKWVSRELNPVGRHLQGSRTFR
ncbi:MAG: reverse transcriptase-like protein [Candidatus Bathyarchaeota archaeon]|nr:reverse transcriptase-like protein [Candidatus Bathyarchaeota archaeon]